MDIEGKLSASPKQENKDYCLILNKGNEQRKFRLNHLNIRIQRLKLLCINSCLFNFKY